MKKGKRVRCLFVAPDENDDNAVSLILQETLCHAFAHKHGWTICKESYASLYFDDEITPNVYKQMNDICCRAVLSEFDVLLIASKSCLVVPEEYIDQMAQWLRENKVETWSVAEGRLA